MKTIALLPLLIFLASCESTSPVSGTVCYATPTGKYCVASNGKAATFTVDTGSSK
jgi:hypothetical protein